MSLVPLVPSDLLVPLDPLDPQELLEDLETVERLYVLYHQQSVVTRSTVAQLTDTKHY